MPVQLVFVMNIVVVVQIMRYALFHQICAMNIVIQIMRFALFQLCSLGRSLAKGGHLIELKLNAV